MEFDIEKAIGERNGECGCPTSAALNSIKEEAEAADLYNKLANMVRDPDARAIYRDIAKEEMAHMGEASQLLSRDDPELAAEVPKGMSEVEKKLKMIQDVPPGWHPYIDGTMDEMMERRQ